MSMWMVPGHPLPDGDGWRVWYSREGTQDFVPAPPVVKLAGQAVALEDQLAWKLYPVIDGFNRRMGILDVRLKGAQPGAQYTLNFPDVRLSTPVHWRTLPIALPSTGVSFLLASCYWRNDDKEGAFSAAVRYLTNLYRPAFKLLVGDQVYQDWPPAVGYDPPLYQYGERYEQYWGDPAYQEALRACPNFCMADDHEFWNDYPEFQSFIPYTYKKENRDARGAVANRLYTQFERALNPEKADEYWFTFNVCGVSFFVADTRTQREEVRSATPRFMEPKQWDALEAWFDSLTAPGVLVLGQPMFLQDGDVKDHSLSNFSEDFDLLCRLIKKCYTRTKPHQILMLSGDIHHARYTCMQVLGVQGKRGEVHEFVSSASAKIRMPSIGSIEAPPAVIPPGGGMSYLKINNHAGPHAENNIGAIRIRPGLGDSFDFDLDVWRCRRDSSWNPLRGLFAPDEPHIKQLGNTITVTLV